MYFESSLKRLFLTYVLWQADKLNSFISSVYFYKISLSIMFDGQNTEVYLFSPPLHPFSSLELHIPFSHKSEFHDI